MLLPLPGLVASLLGAVPGLAEPVPVPVVPAPVVSEPIVSEPVGLEPEGSVLLFALLGSFAGLSDPQPTAANATVAISVAVFNEIISSFLGMRVPVIEPALSRGRVQAACHAGG